MFVGCRMLHYETSASELKTISDVLKDILAECWFVFEESSITMTNVDPEKVVVVSLFVKPKTQDYQCTSKFVFPFYIQTLYRVLRGVKPNDVAIITDGPGASLQIDIMTMHGVKKNQIVLQPLKDNPPVFLRQQHHFDVEIKIETQQLYRILHDLSALSRKVTLTIDQEDVIFSSEDESGTSSVYSQGFPELNYHFKAMYLIKYLEKFTKPGLSDKVCIRVKQNSPLNLVSYLERGYLEMSIAPSG